MEIKIECVDDIPVHHEVWCFELARIQRGLDREGL